MQTEDKIEQWSPSYVILAHYVTINLKLFDSCSRLSLLLSNLKCQCNVLDLVEARVCHFVHNSIN